MLGYMKFFMRWYVLYVFYTSMNVKELYWEYVQYKFQLTAEYLRINLCTEEHYTALENVTGYLLFGGKCIGYLLFHA